MGDTLMWKNKIIFFIVITVVILLNSSAVFAVSVSEWTKQGIVGNWETAAYVDGDQIVLRIASDSEKELHFALRGFMEHLGYEVIWNPDDFSVVIKNNETHIQVFTWDIKVQKNGEEIVLDKPVFIDSGKSYFHQSFLTKVLDMEIVYIDRAFGESHRVHGVYITTDNSIIEAIRSVSESETESMSGYIYISDNTLYVDEVEVIWEWQSERIAELTELGIDLHFMSGYAFHHLAKEKSGFEITDDTLFVFTDVRLNFLEEESITRLYYTISLDEFLFHLNSSYSDTPPAQKVVFFIEVQNDKTVRILEYFPFTI
jgi:hypothetical protein